MAQADRDFRDTSHRSERPRSPKIGCAGLAVLPFAIVWCLAVLAFDAMAINSYVGQQRTTAWTPTPATINDARVVTTGAGDTRSTALIVSYTYTDPDGNTQDSDRYAFGTGPATDADKRAFATNHPRGTATTAYVDPQDPTQAVLVAGVTDGNIRIFYFLLVFNAIGIAMLVTGLNALRIMVKKPAFAGAVASRTGNARYTIRLPRTPPHLAGAIAGVVASGLAGFYLAITSTTASTSPTPVLIAAAASAAVALLVWAHARSSPLASKRDLVVDNDRQTIALPRTFGRDEVVRLTHKHVQSVRLKVRTKTTTSKPGSPKQTELYQTTIGYTDANDNESNAVIAEWHDEARAAMLAQDLAALIDKPFTD